EEARLWGGGDGEFLIARAEDEGRLIAFPFGRGDPRSDWSWFFPYDVSLRISGVPVLSTRIEPNALPEGVLGCVRAWITSFCEHVGYSGAGTAYFLIDADRAWWFDLKPAIETDFAVMASARELQDLLNIQFALEEIQFSFSEDSPGKSWAACIPSWNPIAELPYRAAEESSDSPGFLEPRQWFAAENLVTLGKLIESAQLAKGSPAGRYLRELVAHPRVHAGFFAAGFLESEFVPSWGAVQLELRSAEAPALLAIEGGIVHSRLAQEGGTVRARENTINIRSGGMLVPHALSRDVCLVKLLVEPGDRVTHGQKLAEILVVNHRVDGRV
ncbi:MAG: hypothetical protein AAB425_05090, partial [Bdellovibrionota bacterium]